MNSIVWSFPMISPLHSTSSLKYNRTNSKTKGCKILMSKWTAKWIFRVNPTTPTTIQQFHQTWISNLDEYRELTVCYFVHWYSTGIFSLLCFYLKCGQKEVCYWGMKSPVDKHSLYLATLHSICLKRKHCAVFWRPPCYASALSNPKI